MIKSLLIANRGEIACRIIKTARARNIRTISIFSDPDQDTAHTHLADSAIRITGDLPAQTYLDINKIINIARENNVDAIHPGYGFLSENADFAHACEQNSIIFIGPSAAIIRQMGDKGQAKQLIESIAVPTLPSFQHQDNGQYLSAAKKIGFPVLIKAVAGGGGKGMRIVHNEHEFDAAFNAAQSEAQSSFGDNRILIEKYLTQPRHIEVQVFGDSHKNYITLATRDCSIQRRYQKIIEEAPAPGLGENIEQGLFKAAKKIVSHLGYCGAGTIEFLLQDNEFYFMEMNTRLQVEHPATEQITNQDLVDWQLIVANGGTLPIRQEQLEIKGHSVEARLYAEDPYKEFLPTAGKIQDLKFPPQNQYTRVDSGIRAKDILSPYYDPMIAKIITWGSTREQAITRLHQSLEQTQLAGISHNIDFLKRTLAHSAFQRANLSTAFINQHIDDLTSINQEEIQQAILAATIFYLYQQQNRVRKNKPSSPWDMANSWRMNSSAQQSVNLELQLPSAIKRTLEVKLILTKPWSDLNRPQLSISLEDEEFEIKGQINNAEIIFQHRNQQHKIPFHYSDWVITLYNASHTVQINFIDANAIHIVGEQEQQRHSNKAPMSGRVVKLLAKPEQSLNPGDPVLTLEAMKMEHTIKVSSAGKLLQFYCQEDDLVKEDDILYLFEEISPDYADAETS